ncbi:MAG: hypothetical protein ACFFAY_13795 [Promethearchaeota archaeon]
MAQADFKSIFTRTTPDGERYDPVGRIAGIGAFFGVAAALFGLISGVSLIPMPGMGIAGMQDTVFYASSLVFMGLLSLGLLMQWYWSKELRLRLGSAYSHVLIISAIVTFAFLGFFALNAPVPIYPQEIRDFMSGYTLWLGLFTVFWQLTPIIYVDSSKSWIGTLAGIFTATFLPVLSIGFVFGPLIVTLAYVLLLVGQFLVFLFWWSPLDSIREYARSPDTAKKAFGLTGIITFLIGTIAVFNGPISIEGTVEVWHSFGTINEATGTFWTNPNLVYALCTIQIFWVMLAPRLGAKELKVAHIGDDIIKGGSKWAMLILAAVGAIASISGSAAVLNPANMTFFISVSAPAVMFMMGALYAATTDIITGLPLIVTAIAMLVHPYIWSLLVIIPWIIVLVTQGLLMVETFMRGFTSYSQGVLTVIVSMASSVVFLLFMLGFFGSGPAAMWPTNRWFPIDLFGEDVQFILGYTVVSLPLMMLLIRNVALAGYSHGRGYTGGGILMGLTILFALIIPLIAGNVGIIHIAGTAAALLLGLYAISFVLVLSINLNLASDVEETGHSLEGQIMRVSSASGLVLGTLVAIFAIAVVSGFPDALQISLVITALVTLIAGLEILCLFTWFIAGVRLGMLKEGFSFTRL